MLVVLFGLAGAGKNYIGHVLSEHSDFYFWDADDVMTAEMRSCIQEQRPLSQDIRDRYYAIVMEHIAMLTAQYEHVVVCQAFYKDKNRMACLQQFPDALFIQVEATADKIAQRLSQRHTGVDAAYLQKIGVYFEAPTHSYVCIDNNAEADPALLIAQLMTIPGVGAQVYVGDKKCQETECYTVTDQMPAPLYAYFDVYPRQDAPFMHQQLDELLKTRPLEGLRVLHHVPVVTNTLLKIACLIAAGADVVVTNPSFMQPSLAAIQSLRAANVAYVSDVSELKDQLFDIYFDCGAELYQILGAPKIGAIELTGSGDQFYRQQTLNFPVISIDRTRTKQLETVFGCAESSHTAIQALTGQNPAKKSWVIFGFGKIGRGLAYFCRQHHAPITVIDISSAQRNAARALGVNVIDPFDMQVLQAALSTADIVVTATGGKAILEPYPYEWFQGKILANMGVYDEYGDKFTEAEILNRKAPVNFVLSDPTPMKYIDPEFYIHNIAAFFFRQKQLSAGIHGLPDVVDRNILHRWCSYHGFAFEIIQQWFIDPNHMEY